MHFCQFFISIVRVIIKKMREERFAIVKATKIFLLITVILVNSSVKLEVVQHLLSR